MLTIVLGYKSHRSDAEVVGLYNGHSSAAADQAIAEASKDIVRVEIFKNPVPYKRKQLKPTGAEEAAAAAKAAKKAATDQAAAEKAAAKKDSGEKK